MGLLTRADKGDELEHEEMDDNLLFLRSAALAGHRHRSLVMEKMGSRSVISNMFQYPPTNSTITTSSLSTSMANKMLVSPVTCLRDEPTTITHASIRVVATNASNNVWVVVYDSDPVTGWPKNLVGRSSFYYFVNTAGVITEQIFAPDGSSPFIMQPYEMYWAGLWVKTSGGSISATASIPAVLYRLSTGEGISYVAASAPFSTNPANIPATWPVTDPTYANSTTGQNTSPFIIYLEH